MNNRFRALSASSTASSRSDFRRDVLRGLSQANKRLLCKYFYDQPGGELFEEICQLEEYYPTRCELDILQRRGAAIADRLGAGAALIEYGSGSSRKTRRLLDHLHEPAAYFPVDINGEQVRRTAQQLARLYPRLEVLAVEADFTQPFELPAPHRPPACRVVYVSGSTIGNFEPSAARDLLAGIARLCGRGGGLLLAVDLKKDPRILHAAYNDRRNVTAAFNRNLLARINRELDADFALDRFDHYAFYNPVPGRVEMHLLSRTSQTVHVGEQTFALAAGESICTEYSYKYSLRDCEHLAESVGMRVREVWLDDKELFSIQYLSVEDGGN
ncbi:MAG TPA: L-histidine N(alpha)-methyltransferase [Gemmataceae bacterium]|nr:L-histidine N(alpha)-methyltransferase [Gemmataceae bacterium]